jgi:tripartite-type tricarboxylate transporter receptor subunit TctC
MSTRRDLGVRAGTCALALTFACLGALGAGAQSYPTKPVEMTIPWPPGGRTDIMVRMLAPYLEKELGQPVPVVNRVGGAGVTGMTFFKNSPPDGYMISSGGIALSSMQYQRNIGVTLWDFTWFARAYSTPMVLAVPGTSPFKTAAEFLEFAKANPGKLKHGNTGVGSSTHLASEAMAKKLGIKITQVPYRGEGPATIGLAGAEADFALGLMAAFRTFVEDKKVRVLGIASDARDENVPNVPTLKEQGIDFDYMAFEGLHVPNGVPAPVLARLSGAAKSALTNPELKKKFADIGLTAVHEDGPAFTAWLKGWDADVKAQMKELGIYGRD